MQTRIENGHAIYIIGEQIADYICFIGLTLTVMVITVSIAFMFMIF